MSQQIKLPDLGEGIDSAEVVTVLVEPGDSVQAEQGVLEIETDKATMEVPCPQAGKVEEVNVQAGDTIEPGQVILTLAGDSQAQDEGKDEPEADASEAPQESRQEESQAKAEDEKEKEPEPETEPHAEKKSSSDQESGQVVEIKMPEVGEGVESGEVVSVLVEQGQDIQAEQGIAEIETDKATVEIPCDQSGKVQEIRISAGDSVKVGQVLLTLEVSGAAPTGQEEDQGEKAPKEEPSGQSEEDSDKEQQEPAKPKARKDRPQEEDRFRRQLTGDDLADRPAANVPRKPQREKPVIPAGPATRRHARELGVDLSMVEGSGPGGRIQKEDVDAAVRKMSQAMQQTPGKPSAGGASKAPKPSEPSKTSEETDSHGPIRREKMSKIRQTIARRMSESKSAIPHVTNFDDVDVTDLEAFRQAHKNDFETKLTLMPFVVKAVANALAHHPVLNASVDLESNEVIYKEYFSLGIAVDTDRGLMVPVLREADELSIAEIASAMAEVAGKARSGEISLEDLRGSTFTISNLGSVGGRYSTPVINAPESAILLLGRSRREPRVMEDGSIQARMMLPLSLSYDHRIVDGADAGRFLEEVKSYLASPGKLLLTI